MRIDLRAFLLGSVSVAVLGASGAFWRASGPPAACPSLNALTGAVGAISELINQPSLIGVDFCDIAGAVLRGGGRAVYGVGEAKGPDRARIAAERALADIRRQRIISSPN